MWIPNWAKESPTAFGSRPCQPNTKYDSQATPNLQYHVQPLSLDAFRAVVVGGAKVQPFGMPKFADLRDEDLVALQNFVRQQAEVGAKAAEKAEAK